MEFGERQPGVAYADRPSVYGLAFDEEGRVFCVRGPGGLYLPGGGLLDGEAPEEGLRREVREETGYDIVVGELVGRASQVVPAFIKHGTFFRMRLDGDQQPVGPFDHQSVWLARDEAERSLSEEFHAWALRQVTP